MTHSPQRVFGRHGPAISNKNLGRNLLKPSRNSKYRPHQGAKEIARRKRQAEKAKARE